MAVALPIESNPETMSQYLHKLGVADQWRIVDVLGLDKDTLALVPRPVLAIILLFPLSDVYEVHRTAEEIKLKSSGNQPPQNIFHLKQVLSNVCGTIALVHSVANNTSDIEIKDGPLKKYIEDAMLLNGAAERGALLENSMAILDAYKEVVNIENDAEEPVNNHFVTFIHKDGKLFELDGRKSAPVDHGPTTADTFLEDAAKVCREFIAREPNNIGFNVVALIPNQFY